MTGFQTYPLIRPEVTEFIASQLDSGDRVLVTGSTGWFGKTLAGHLLVLQVPSMFLSSKPREVNVGKLRYETNSLDLGRIRDFAPTVIFDFAALTRDKVVGQDSGQILRTNVSLASSTVFLMSLESVRLVFCTSSGAVVEERRRVAKSSSDSYARSKIRTETMFAKAAKNYTKPVVCIRPWSVSGPLVSSRQRYAFSSIVEQSIGGHIKIHSKQNVFRRYVSVDDLLAGALWNSHNQDSSFAIFDSGGELIELEDLARIAAHASGFDDSIISRPQVDKSMSDDYSSTNDDWAYFVRKSGFEAESIREQVLRTMKAFRSEED